MLANFARMICEELMKHYQSDKLQIQRIDLVEGAELVRRSRKKMISLCVAVEFEENFMKVKSKIPKSYFLRTTVEISGLCAMIFVLHYIEGKKSVAANLKQSLKKNSSFRAFAYDLDVLLRELTALGVLAIEQRVKRRRVEVPIQRGVNEINIVQRSQGFFKIIFNENNENQRDFLQFYQAIYPGAVFGEKQQ